MENPIKAARIRLGMSKSDLSVALKRSREWIYLLESGQVGSLSERAQELFSELGLDGKALAKEYDSWKEARRNKIMYNLKER